MKQTDYSAFTANDYLDAAKAHFGVDSDRQLASRLGVTPGSISQYRSGARAMDDYCAVQIATFLRIDPMLVIAAANEQREKAEPRKQFWREIQVSLTTVTTIAFAAILSVSIIANNTVFSGDYAFFSFLPAIYYAHIEQVALVLILIVFSLSVRSKKLGFGYG